MKFSTDYWQKTESYIEFIIANELPAGIPVSAVKLVSIVDRAILLVDTPKGWDIPGGHLEGSETAQEALHREIKEETGGILNGEILLGYLQITNKIENEFNKNYPKVSCIAIYQGVVNDISNDLHHESVAAEYHPLNNLPSNIADWSQLSQEIIDYTVSLQS